MQDNLFNYAEKQSVIEEILARVEDLPFEEQMNYLNFKLTEKETNILYGINEMR